MCHPFDANKEIEWYIPDNVKHTECLCLAISADILWLQTQFILSNCIILEWTNKLSSVVTAYTVKINKTFEKCDY